MMEIQEARQIESRIGELQCKVCGEPITNYFVRVANILEGRQYCEIHFWEWKRQLLKETE